jgi:hypothetical protein
MTWTLAKGYKGPVIGLRASGLWGLDPLFTHYSSVPSSRVKSPSRKGLLTREDGTDTLSRNVGKQ